MRVLEHEQHSCWAMSRLSHRGASGAAAGACLSSTTGLQAVRSAWCGQARREFGGRREKAERIRKNAIILIFCLLCLAVLPNRSPK